MRVTKMQIINGLAAYIQDELLPKMDVDKAMQIMLDVAIHSIKANERLINSVFEHEVVKSILDDNGSGEYEIGNIIDAIHTSIDKYGAFPVSVPPIPLISPKGSIIKLDASDIISIRKRIESK